MKKLYIFIIFTYLVSYLVFSQDAKRDNSWILGYEHPNGSYPIGPMLINFNNQTPSITLIQDTLNLGVCNASISDTLGNLLFYTNGIEVRDKNNVILQNGDSLNYGDLWETWQGAGLPVRQSALILPIPEHPTEYFIIHNTLKEYLQSNYYPTEVLYSKVDMSLNQGLGAVVAKNQTLFTLDKGDGTITACRHGNGRDWWLLFSIKGDKCYERFLLTPTGFENKGQACIDGITFDAVWEARYSQDGTKYARFQDATLHIMDFDRCNGLYSNLITIPVYYNPDSTGSGGVEFSPSSRYLYLTNGGYAYQYDMWASDIGSSIITIGVIDGLPDPYSPGGFTGTTLAPNGKIYVNAGSVLSVPVIQYPDSAGLSCHFEQHGLVLPHLNNTIPNFPNFRLGAAFGSGCDSLTVSHQVAVSSAQSKVYPNPAHNTLYIELSKQAQAATFALFDLSGKEVFSQSLTSSNTQIQLGKLPKGVYLYTIFYNNHKEYGKLLIE